jgi:hypothetical protein
MTLDTVSFYAIFGPRHIRDLVYIGLYMLLGVSSIYMLWRQPRTPCQRALLPYTSCMLILNTAFFLILAINADDLLQYYGNAYSQSHLNAGLVDNCGRVSISLQVLRTVPVLLNDIVFVSYYDSCVFELAGN